MKYYENEDNLPLKKILSLALDLRSFNQNV